MATPCSRPPPREWRLDGTPCWHASAGGCETFCPRRPLTMPASRKWTDFRGCCTLSAVRGSASQVAEKVPRRERGHVEPNSGERGSHGVGQASGGGVTMGRTERGVAGLVAEVNSRHGTGRSHGHASRSAGYQNETPGPGEGHAVRKTRKGKASVIVETSKAEKSKKKGAAFVGESKEKASKKAKVNSPVASLRVRLDMCSKRGDVMGAISLYDSAVREGVELEQYHYNVLLYLCASAAGGLIQPAKSGRGRTIDGAVNLVSDVLDGSRAIQFNGVRTALKDLDGSISGDNHTVNMKVEYVSEDDRAKEVAEDLRKYALNRGFEIYKKMCLQEIPLSEAALTSVGRLAMSIGDGDMAFEVVKKIKDLGLTVRLRSYGPALFTYCSSGDIEKAFEVERHMGDCGISPEEPELQALLGAAIAAGRGERVYYILQKLRTSVRQVSPATAELIEAWFKSSSASRVGKRKWDQSLIETAFENGGGGWHGLGWLGKGKWTVVHARVDANGICENCGDKLVTIDLDPTETETFAKSVASIAGNRERNKNFENFQKWLDYYGPFDAVIDAANVGLFSQRRFSLTKVNCVLNGIRQKLSSKKWPLVVVHNKRVYGGKMNDPANKILEKWKNADAIYATPTGSNDDWYWLYAAIKCKSLIVTNDEMRDHIFQILGNDFFPKWKERHQVHFRFNQGSPEFLLPPPCSIIIQESKNGHWHVPIAVEEESDQERSWLCVTRAGTLKETDLGLQTRTASAVNNQERPSATCFTRGRRRNIQDHVQNAPRRPGKRLLADGPKDQTVVFKLQVAEKQCGGIIDFQI